MQADAGLQNAADAMHWLHKNLERQKANQQKLSTSTMTDCQANGSKTKVLCIKQYEGLSVPMLLLMC